MPDWKSPRIEDPDGDAIWLAVDTYPTEEAARAEALTGHKFAKVLGRERYRLRDLDLDDEDDAYLHEEWGCTTTAEPDVDGREFWMIATSPQSMYLP